MKKNKHLRNLVVALIVIGIVVGVLGGILLIDSLGNRAKQDIDIEQAQAMVDEALDSLPNNVAMSAKYIRSRSKVTVTDLKYGTHKDIQLQCTYETIDVHTTIKSRY